MIDSVKRKSTFLLIAVIFSVFIVFLFGTCDVAEYPYYIRDDIYAIDLVFCIDISGSMGGQLEQIKTNIITLYEKLKEMMLGDNKYISALRAKIVLFSDIYVDGEAALQETKMYNLPGEEKALSDYVQGILLLGGGDEPESGLEALGMAMRSAWNKDPMKKRDVIFLWSDASALSLTPEAWPYYVPSGLYRSLESMTDAWRNDTRNPDGKRLILFAPEVEPWSTIAATWNDAFIYPDYAAGTNMDFDTVLEVIIEGL